MLTPPSGQLSIISNLEALIPIDLRDDIVDPSLLSPVQYVRTQVIIGLQTIRLTATRPTPLITIDTEGADPKAYPRLRLE